MFTLQCFTGGIAQTNGWLLALNDIHILVDAPEGVGAWLEGKKVKVAALILTHQHFDHVLDAAEIADTHGCPVLAWNAFSRDLTLERLYGAVSGSPFHVKEFKVTHVLEGERSVEIGGREWTLFHIPGHSPDSVCFHQPELGLVLGGDVLFQSGVGRTDFPGGSWEMLLTGIERDLLPLPDQTRVLPGHGAETTIGRERMGNPFLNQL